ncbi:hypothetical protein RhiJN_08055 [Ceratobasidium sp. AG-Ba]|nr:hypothetical protein RhiJN_08055 [Ceratobasidium sp. AG-Ba]
MDANNVLDESYKQKNKKPPAPRDGAKSSESELEPLDDEVAQLRAENARLCAKFQHQSGELANNPVPAVPASGTTPVKTTRIPPPNTKTQINATKWRKMLGWEDSKGPWLQCWQQDLADLSSAVALKLVKRVPQLERFEKNWGALQLLQETFNHMRATFLANKLLSGSENDNYIRKKCKKDSALKTAKEERESGKGEQKSTNGERLLTDEEHSSDDLSNKGQALEKNMSQPSFLRVFTFCSGCDGVGVGS